MKNISLFVWFSQLAISVIAPLGGAIWLSVWLYQKYELGIWVIVVGAVVGFYGAIDGLRTSLKAMERLAEQSKDKKSDQRKKQDEREQKDCNS